MDAKWALPQGRLNIRHRQMRGVWQAFSGNTYIDHASGDSPEEAAEQIRRLYAYAPGTPVKVHGFRYPSTIIL